MENISIIHRQISIRTREERGLPPTCEIFVNSPGSDREDREETDPDNFSFNSQNNYLPVPSSDLKRFSLEGDSPGLSTVSRLSVPSITPPGLAKSYGIKSVLNISLSSLFPSLSSSKDQEPTVSVVRRETKLVS